MKLLQFNHRFDFGHEFYVQILNTGKHFPKLLKDRSLLQFSLSWNESPSWPYMQITSGGAGPFSFMIWVYKFGFDFDILSRTWNWNYLKEETDD